MTDGICLFNTAEIRWFWPERNVESIQSWFVGAGPMPDSEIRTDIYLVLPGCETTGVKLRNNNFEIKALAETAGSCFWPTGQSGLLQRWVKWSLASPKLPTLLDDLLSVGIWQSVTKERLLRKFTASPETFTETGSAHSDGEEGCSVELTRVTTDARQPSWLTFGFEAFGPNAKLFDILNVAAGHFFSRHGSPSGVELSEANSLSYPGWLKGVNNGTQEQK
jgi:hypothetical protein